MALETDDGERYRVFRHVVIHRSVSYRILKRAGDRPWSIMLREQEVRT